MKPENQMWAGFFLIVHAIFIAIGIGVAYFAPFDLRVPTRTFEVSISSLFESPLSIKQLEAWNRFLDARDRWMRLDTQDVQQFLLDKPKLRQLDFFVGVETSGRAEYLADRLRIVRDPDWESGRSLKWEASVSDADEEESALILNNLAGFLENRIHELEDFAALHDGGKRIRVSNLGLDDAHDSDGLEPAIPPTVAALVAVMVVIVAWTVWIPGSGRTIPFTLSVCQFGMIVVCFALIGGLSAYFVDAFGKTESQSECAIQFVRCSTVAQHLTPAPKRELVRKIYEKLPTCDYENVVKSRRLVQELVSGKGLRHWRSFQGFIDDGSEAGSEPGHSDEEINESIVELVLGHLEVEADPDVPAMLTLRFRCLDRIDASSVLDGLLEIVDNHLESQSGKVRDFAIAGAPMAIETTELKRLSTPKSRKVRWPRLDCQALMDGANLGAIAACILLSSIRVLAGVPPI